ncbi:tachylectin-related carbohydrate-binding protein [Actinoalloteichus hymeniacidonis]|nr:tachylectin-related carbohydrate-binding protein [Actinoalloteichus hymeniacidonis]MBB5906437.1 hypothetical protein [Actinoalloteichus hymeniacidonis]
MPRRTGSALTLLFVLAGTTLTSVPAGAQQPAAETDLDARTCLSTANIFTHGFDRSLWLAEQQDVLSDTPSWGPDTRLTPNWSGPPIGLPDGGVLQAYPNGQLWYLELEDRAWKPNPNGRRYRIIDEDGWARWTQSANRDLITADSQGMVFAVDADGALTVSQPDRRDDSWPVYREVIDTGWEQYDLIFAAGDGVLYARKPDDTLLRFQYHHGSQRWLEYAQPAGGSWDHSHLFSIGADLVYGVDESTGNLVGYRWDRNTDGWETGANFEKLIGTGWSGYRDITADGATCTYDSTAVPSAPTPENDRSHATSMIEGSDGLIRIYFNESSGRLLEALQSYPDDPTRFIYTIPDRDRRFAGQPSALRSADGEIHRLAHGTDSTTWQVTRDDEWGFTSLGGWTPGPAQLVETADQTVAAIAVSEDGGLLYRELGSTGWRLIGGSDLTSDFGVVAADQRIYVVARDSQGTLQFTTIEDGVATAWITLPGTGFGGKPSLVVDSAGKLRVFARGPDARIHELREETLDAGWSAVGEGREFTGSPATVIRNGDRVTVVARGSDDYLWVAVQDLFDNTKYGEWTQLVDSRTGTAYPTSTDAAVLRNSDGYLLINFVGFADELYVYRSAYPDTGPLAQSQSLSEGDEPNTDPLAEFDGHAVTLTETG